MLRAFSKRMILHHAVVGVLGEVHHAVREDFPPHVKAVHIALGAAGGDVAPCLPPLQVHHVSEGVDHLIFNLVSVHKEAAAVEWVSDVVGAVLEKREQLRVVEVLVARVAHLLRANLLNIFQQKIETLLNFSISSQPSNCVDSGIAKSSNPI